MIPAPPQVQHREIGGRLTRRSYPLLQTKIMSRETSCMSTSLSGLETTTDQLQIKNALAGVSVQLHSRKPAPPPLRQTILNPNLKTLRKTQLRTLPGDFCARTRKRNFRTFAPPALDLSCSSPSATHRAWTPSGSTEMSQTFRERIGRHLGDMSNNFSLAKVLGEVACSRHLLQQVANLGLDRNKRSPTSQQRQSPQAAQHRSPVRFLHATSPNARAAPPPLREVSPEVRYLPGCGMAAVRKTRAVRLRGLNSRCTPGLPAAAIPSCHCRRPRCAMVELRIQVESSPWPGTPAAFTVDRRLGSGSGPAASRVAVWRFPLFHPTPNPTPLQFPGLHQGARVAAAAACILARLCRCSPPHRSPPPARPSRRRCPCMLPPTTAVGPVLFPGGT
jgi:hypothetical protein